MSEMNSVPARSKRIGQYSGLASSSAQPPKLLDRLREALRARHYSRRTEQTYCHWVKRFIYFRNLRHPAQMAEPEINAYLTHLKAEGAFKCRQLLTVSIPKLLRTGAGNGSFRGRIVG